MTRMADPERRRGELDDDEARFEDEGRRSIFSALWFRTILVVVVLGVVAAVAVPYVLELANEPPPKPTIVTRPEPLAPAPVAPPPATTPAPSPSAEKPPVVEKPPVAERPAPSPMSESEKPAAAKKADASKSAVAKDPAAPRSTKAAAAKVATAPGGAYFVQVGAFKSQETAKRLATRAARHRRAPAPPRREATGTTCT